jgi:hypothetical protein
VRRIAASKLESELRRKHVPASIRETAFNCPHCGAFTSQSWYKADTFPYADGETPIFPGMDFIDATMRDGRLSDQTIKQRIAYTAKISEGLLFFEASRDGPITLQVTNLNLSKCFNCQEIAVWVHDRLLFPPELHEEEPNDDLPPDILADYQEARSILNLSPRGAAALLRLAIQKLCGHLGEGGKNINADIASLVKKGLSPIIQKSLDVVRVIGNEAVHPGTLDLKDDRDTASKLFRLVNLIAEQMISHPKHVHAMYEELPESKRKEIEKRDG